MVIPPDLVGKGREPEVKDRVIDGVQYVNGCLAALPRQTASCKAASEAGRRSLATRTFRGLSYGSGLLTHTGHGHRRNTFLAVLPKARCPAPARLRLPTMTRSWFCAEPG